VIGVGIDTVDVARFTLVLTRRRGLADRLFTAGEVATASGSMGRLAARFAAKEATMKAMGVGLGACKFREIEVVREESGQPVLMLSGAALALAGEKGVRTWHVSMTHTALVAEAIVIAE
jgi:holo-[acyl-carrier protein] synthase